MNWSYESGPDGTHLAHAGIEHNYLSWSLDGARANVKRERARNVTQVFADPANLTYLMLAVDEEHTSATPFVLGRRREPGAAACAGRRRAVARRTPAGVVGGVLAVGRGGGNRCGAPAHSRWRMGGS
jgi:hypothetical protein